MDPSETDQAVGLGEPAMRRLRPQLSSCSAIPEEHSDISLEEQEEAGRAVSWHHPERSPGQYQVLVPSEGLTAAARNQSFRSISHDSAFGGRPLSFRQTIITNEGLQDWVLAAAKISRNALTNPILNSSLNTVSFARTLEHPPVPVDFPLEKEESPTRTSALSTAQVLAYAVGHVGNDLTAACWFTYMLYFLQNIAITGDNVQVKAGQVMLAGQVVDAITTPIVGVVSDYLPGWGCLRGTRWEFGTRKMWHFCGALMNAVCFAATFGFDPFPPSTMASFMYLVTAASLWNMGWAAVQVSHLALIPELTPYDNERVKLVSLRYTFTVLSNLFVFILYLTTGEDSRHKYLVITLTVLVVGLVACGAFWAGVKEPVTKAPEEYFDEVVDSATASKDSWGSHVEVGAEGLDKPLLEKASRPPSLLHWFTVKDFYLVGFVYMCTRVIVNISQVYLTLYIQDTLYRGRPASESARERALVPLTLYLSSFITTFRLEAINRRLGRKMTFALGASIVILASIIFFVIGPETWGFVYVAASLLGLGNASIMVTSVSMEGDLVGHETSSGAFVYGALSFTDKLSNGLIILLLTTLQQSSCPVDDPEHLYTMRCSDLYTKVMAFSPAVPALLATLAAFMVSHRKAA